MSDHPPPRFELRFGDFVCTEDEAFQFMVDYAMGRLFLRVDPGAHPPDRYYQERGLPTPVSADGRPSSFDRTAAAELAATIDRIFGEISEAPSFHAPR